MVSGILLLRDALQQLPALAQALATAQSPLLAALHFNLSKPLFKRMLDKIEEVGYRWRPSPAG